MNEDTTTRFKRVNTSYTVETSKLIERLEQGETGDIVTDEELERVCGLPTGTGGKGYAYLHSAIKFHERQGIVWNRIKGANAIKRSTTDEIISRSEADTKVVRRRMKRSTRRLGAVSVDSLSDEQKRKFNTTSSIVGTIALMADTQTQKKLEARNIQEPMDVQRMLEAWPNKT